MERLRGIRWRTRGASVRTAAALVLALAAGCGLRDYEDHLDAQRKRVEVFDEEQRFLGPVLENPGYEGADGNKVPIWPFDVFLRLPAGIQGELGKKDSQFNYLDLPLYRYAGGDGFNAFVAAGLIAPAGGKGKEDKPRPAEWPVEAFREHVRGALIEYYFKAYGIGADFPLFDRAKFKKMEKRPVSDRGALQPPIEYEAIAFRDDFNRNLAERSLFQVYFHEEGNKQVAIVFQSPASWMTKEALIKGVDWSLKTLDIAGGGPAKRAALRARGQGH